MQLQCTLLILFDTVLSTKEGTRGFEVLARVFDSTKHLGATNVGMTFRVLHFGTLGTAQYGDAKRTHIEARKVHSPGWCRRLSRSIIEL